MKQSGDSENLYMYTTNNLFNFVSLQVTSSQMIQVLFLKGLILIYRSPVVVARSPVAIVRFLSLQVYKWHIILTAHTHIYCLFVCISLGATQASHKQLLTV